MTVNEYKQAFIDLFNELGHEHGRPTRVYIHKNDGVTIEMGGIIANPIVCTIEF